MKRIVKTSGKMGRMPDQGNWPEQNENLFTQMLCERVRRDPDQNPSLRNSDWEEMDNELFATVGVRYSTERLKGKYYRLRYKFRHFLELVETRGVTWNAETNTVHAPEKIWQALIKQSKEFRTFRRKGCKQYELYRQIFPDIAARKSHHLPGSSYEKHQTEGEFLNRGLPIGESELSGGSSTGDSSKGRKSQHVACDVAAEHHPQKKLKMERFDEALDAWVTALNARTVDKANAEKDASQISKDTSQISKDSAYVSDVYSIERVMDILESMSGVPTAAYMKAVDKFTNPDWRKIFVKMSAVRRREWLKTLE